MGVAMQVAMGAAIMGTISCLTKNMEELRYVTTLSELQCLLSLQLCIWYQPGKHCQ